MLAACQQDEVVSDTDNTPSVEYADGEVSNEIANYTNADWLYENYLGEYGIPNELKYLIEPELQLMANGFALQLARGEDVEKSISAMNAMFEMAYLSGQIGDLKQSMLAHNEMNLSTSNSRVIRDELPDVERFISEEAQRNIGVADSIERAFEQSQLALVEKYNLPYKLPRHINKYLMVSALQSKKDDNGNANYSHGIKNWNWWTADIIHCPKYQGDFNAGYFVDHVALVQDNGPGWITIIDAHPDNPNRGVDIHYWSDDWEKSYQQIDGYYYKHWKEWDNRRNYVWSNAQNYIGKPYSVYANSKWDKTKFYCSKLVWKAYHEEGVDLDRDGDFHVYPSDIVWHSDVMKRFQSSN